MSVRTFVALGTGSQVPTRERNHNGYFVRWDEHGFLFDPGEGTQRQMTFAGVSASEITKIFITHFHGDHCLGLPGVLQRLSLDRVAHEVEIFYPESGRQYFENLKNASVYHNTASIKETPISESGIIYRNEKITIQTQKLDHSVESWGYRFEESDSVSMLPEKLAEIGITGKNVGELKNNGSLEIEGRQIIRLEDVSVVKRGQSFAFVMDTGICDSIYELARNVDLLICESTYLSSETDDAIKNKHLTVVQTAEIAKKAGVDKLVLTHFSPRYKTTDDFAAEAKNIHSNVVAARDGKKIKFPKRDRNELWRK
jgi:ribonuclease Z